MMLSSRYCSEPSTFPDTTLLDHSGIIFEMNVAKISTRLPIATLAPFCSNQDALTKMEVPSFALILRACKRWYFLISPVLMPHFRDSSYFDWNNHFLFSQVLWQVSYLGFCLFVLCSSSLHSGLSLKVIFRRAFLSILVRFSGDIISSSKANHSYNLLFMQYFFPVPWLSIWAPFLHSQEFQVDSTEHDSQFSNFKG